VYNITQDKGLLMHLFLYVSSNLINDPTLFKIDFFSFSSVILFSKD